MTRRLRPAIGSFVIRALGRLPLSLTRPMGRIVAWASYLTGARAVQTSRDNIRRCFPELDPVQREALVKKSVEHTAFIALEAPAAWARSYTALQRHLAGFEGLELVETQRTTGRGLLVLGPHLGNWEFVGSILPHHLEPLTYMYQPTGMAAIDSLIVRGRSKDRVQLAPTTRKGVSQVLKALQAGETAVILPDQVPDEGAGKLANFFGQPAYTMTLVYKLIQRTGCDVLMMYGKRVTGGFTVVVREADPAIKSGDMNISLEALNHSVEMCVREAPEQYQWEYKRFKGIPQSASI